VEATSQCPRTGQCTSGMNNNSHVCSLKQRTYFVHLNVTCEPENAYQVLDEYILFHYSDLQIVEKRCKSIICYSSGCPSLCQLVLVEVEGSGLNKGAHRHVGLNLSYTNGAVCVSSTYTGKPVILRNKSKSFRTFLQVQQRRQCFARVNALNSPNEPQRTMIHVKT
jgi:hypothetical protein